MSRYPMNTSYGPTTWVYCIRLLPTSHLPGYIILPACFLPPTTAQLPGCIILPACLLLPNYLGACLFACIRHSVIIAQWANECILLSVHLGKILWNTPPRAGIEPCRGWSNKKHSWFPHWAMTSNVTFINQPDKDKSPRYTGSIT